MSFEQKYLKYRKKYLELKQQIGGEDDERLKIIESVKLDGLSLNFAPDNFKDDKEVVLTAINQNAMAIRFASERLKNDRELVISAVNKNGWVLRYLLNFNNDKEIVMLSLKFNGLILIVVSDILKDDEEVVFEALTHLPQIDSGYERMFPLISSRLKNNKEFILKVLKFDDKYYHFLSDDLKNDKEFFLTACENIPNPTSLIDNMPQELCNDSDLMVKLITLNRQFLKKISTELKNNKEFVIKILKLSGRYYHIISDNLKNDKEIFLIACENVQDHQTLITSMPEDFGNDRDFMIKLINFNFNFFNRVSIELKNDIGFCKLAILTNCLIYEYVSENMLINLSDKIDIVRKLTIECKFLSFLIIIKQHSPKMFDIDYYIEELVKKYGASYFNLAGDILKDNINIIKKMCGINSNILYYISRPMRDNEELFKDLLEISPVSLLYASGPLRRKLKTLFARHLMRTFGFEIRVYLLQLNYNITIEMYESDELLLNYLPRY